MILEKIRQTNKRYALFKRGDTILIGVSGGPDSLTLLYSLYALTKEFDLSLHVAHLDHMLRSDSGKDAAFVQKVCSKLGIPFTVGRINCKAIAFRGSREEICRNARLGFFFRIAKEIHADSIALGHTSDDQAETVLMRLIRGTGLYGLSAILPKRKLGTRTIIRPLLEISRKEVENFLKRRKLKPRLDSSNSQDIFFRNKIRNRLLPLLAQEYNRNIKTILSSTALSTGDDYDFLLKHAAALSARYKTNIPLKKFTLLHPSMQRLLLRLAYAYLKGDTRRFTFTHIRELLDLAVNRPCGSLVDLPGRISVKKTKKTIVFYRSKSRLKSRISS